MNTTPKLASTVQIAEPYPAPKKKFRVSWLELTCQIAFGVALGLLAIAIIEGYQL